MRENKSSRIKSLTLRARASKLSFLELNGDVSND